MSKVLKFFVLVIIILGVICCSTDVYALNMNLENNTNNTANTNDNTNATSNTTSNANVENNNSSYGKSNITTQITVSTQELTISNALSICLIAVGVVIILLAIAILIKLKK